MFNTISAKLLTRMLIISTAGIVIGLIVVFNFSAKLQNTTAENLIREKQDISRTLTDAKIETTFAITQAFASANNKIGQMIEDRTPEPLHALAKQITNDFARTSDLKGISYVIFDKNNNIFMRSFAKMPDPAFGKKAPRDFSELLTGKSTGQAEISLSGVGLFITASVPIYQDGTPNSPVVGVLDSRSGIDSIVRTLKNKETNFAIVLNEQATERWKDLAKNPKLGSYYLAHNSWFSDNQAWFSDLNIDQLVETGFMIQNKKAIGASPLTNEKGEVIGHYLTGIDMSHPDMVNAINSVNKLINIMLVLMILMITTMMIFLWVTSKKVISQPIQSILSAIRSVESTGKINIKLHSNAKDEVGEMTRAFASLMQQIHQALTEANSTVGAIAKGDFSQTMQGEYSGDLNTLKQGVNASAQSVAFMMSELTKVMNALENGKFDVRMDKAVAENFRQMVENAMNSTQTVIDEINQTLAEMQNGHFHTRVTSPAKGSLDKLKQHVNQSLDALETAINEINKVMSSQSAGDLTQTITGQYLGELDTLKQAINASGNQLNRLVTDAIEVSNQVNNAAAEVSRGALDLSDRVQQQAASLEQTSATMDQMNSAVQNNTEHAKQAASVAHQVQNQATQGNEVMRNTISAMASIQESSQQIAEIVNLIDGIAFQTNLLALNAAVEAARAGEHGRGFAVVAGEVRALAQRSADAARDIKNLINESVERIDEGTNLATKSGEALEQIITSIMQVSEMIDQIAQASAEQAEGISQVNLAITQIDSGTQQNAALVEETSAAAESLSEQASILRSDMAKFTTNKSGSAPKTHLALNHQPSNRENWKEY